jgi:hypothetical protein
LSSVKLLPTLVLMLLGGCSPTTASGPSHTTASPANGLEDVAIQVALAANHPAEFPHDLFPDHSGPVVCTVLPPPDWPLPILGSLRQICAQSSGTKDNAGVWTVTFTEYWDAAQYHAAFDPATGRLAHLWTFMVVLGHGYPTSSSEQGNFPPQAAKPGGPVPDLLQGDWFFHRSDGWVQLSLNAEQYSLRGIQNPGFGAPAAGNVVANGNEIDFFDGDQCGIPLPGGIGRYRWTVSGKLLQLMPLNDDPCGRSEDLAGISYQRTIPAAA